MPGLLNSYRFGVPVAEPVVFLSEFSGVDEATTAVDLSPYAKTITFAGAAKIDSGVQLFGNNTGLKTSSTSDRITVPDDANWPNATESWTAEGWFYFPSLTGAGDHMLMGQYTSSSDERQWGLYTNGGNMANLLVFRSSGTGGTTGTSMFNVTGLGLTTGVWYHMCVERDTATGNWRLYLDGVMVGKVSYTSTLHDSVGAFSIGSQLDGVHPTALRWANIRITKGLALYASDSGFTVPTGPYPVP